MAQQQSLRELLGKVLTKIEPTPKEDLSAWSHGNSIKASLKAQFDLGQLVRMGSRPRDTAIRRFSDADYLAVVPRDSARRGGEFISSDRLLDKFRESLRTRFTQTHLKKNRQAVTVYFGQANEAVDVVPALFSHPHETKWPVYAIPDGSGDWMNASPALHNDYFKTANQRSGWKLASVCRLLKLWKHSRVRPVPMLSFHVEMLLASADTCVGAKSLAACLLAAFDLLLSEKCQALSDPCNVSGDIPICWSDAQEDTILESMGGSRDHIWRAVMYDEDDHPLEACDQMRIAFNRCF